MTIKRKIENGLLQFIDRLKADSTNLKRYAGYEGSQADDRKVPSYIIEATGSEEATPFGPVNVTVELMIVTQIDDNEGGELPSVAQRRKVRTRHDNALDAINTALDGPGALEALQIALNAGGSRRMVDEFHIYDITKTDERHAFEGRCFVDALTFLVVAQPYDADASENYTADSTSFTADTTHLTADAA